MPVYITYFTESPDAGGTLFCPDPYERDAKVLARFADKGPAMREARPPLTINLDDLPKSGPHGDAKDKSPSKRQDGGKPRIGSPATRKTLKPAADGG
jgi:hypothetical protein